MNNTKCLALIFIVGLALLAVIPMASTAQQADDSQRINEINVTESGDAVWTIEIREPLETESERENFQFYVDQVNNDSNTQQLSNYESDFQEVISSADDRYDRNMSLEYINLNASIQNTPSGEVGITEVEFYWSGFGKIQDNTILVGDILSDGYALSESEKLSIIGPEGYEMSEQSSQDGGSISGQQIEWFGPHSFNNLELEYTDSSQSQGPSSNSSNNWLIILIIGGSIVLLITALVLFKLYSDKKSQNETTEKINSTGSMPDDPENEVMEYLRENDGRVKQKDLTEDLDWSKTKVSRVTSSLEEQDKVSKLRIGRENIIEIE